VSQQGSPVDRDGRTRRRERNAMRLYDAANVLLAAQSFEELTVEQICDRAGVGKATFFRIFESKAGLLREFNRRLAQDAADRIASSGCTDVRTTLGHVRAAIVDAWRQAGPGHVGMAREFIRSMPSTELHAAHPELLHLVAEVIATAVASGELPDRVPADLAASLVLLQMVAPMTYMISGQQADIDELSRLLLDQWLAGMAHLAT
jgi:AcrR family transcriptional regulator